MCIALCISWLSRSGYKHRAPPEHFAAKIESKPLLKDNRQAAIEFLRNSRLRKISL